MKGDIETQCRIVYRMRDRYKRTHLFVPLARNPHISHPRMSQTYELLLAERARESGSDIMDSRQPNFF